MKKNSRQMNFPLLNNVVRGLIIASIGSFTTVSAEINGGLNKGKFYGDFRLRYETIDQDNSLEDAEALTLRSRLGYQSPTFEGFSALVEVEDIRELVDDFSVPPAGVRAGQFSVIADPEGTEIDQVLIQYVDEKLSIKVGRQLLALDGHRFIGDVGWRQDRQTFDAIVLNYKPSKDVNINASYIDKRNRIFSDENDIDSKDTIFNGSYNTPFGKLVGYAYLLEDDTVSSNSIDTYGVSFGGTLPLQTQTLLYSAEIATQKTNDEFDTDYLLLEAGINLGDSASGLTAKLGFEKLGSDNGAEGFATPLATLHKFNGWSDQFLATPNQGLEDIYVNLSGKIFGGKWAAVYHDYSSDVGLIGADDLGDEINLLYTRGFGDNVAGGVKYADYSAGDAEFSNVDTKNAWLWLSYKF